MKVSEKAANELKKILAGFEEHGAGIRIFTIRNCCGSSIQMDIASQPGADETVVSMENIDFFIKNDLLETLSTLNIDYGPDGFILNRLQRSSGCCRG